MHLLSWLCPHLYTIKRRDLVVIFLLSSFLPPEVVRHALCLDISQV
jgi:hypothetical protein